MSISPQFSHIFTLNTNHLPSHFYLFQFPVPFLSNFTYTGADWLYFPPGHNLIKPAHELKRCNSVTRNTQKCKCLNALKNFFSFVIRMTYPTGQPAHVKYIFQFPHTSVLFIFHLYDHYITL